MRKRCLLIQFFICISILNCFSQSGTPDPSFGSNGKINANFGFPYFRISSGCVQPDGKIIIAGLAENKDRDFMLIRFLPDGKPDNSFGNGGVVYTDIYKDDYLEKILLLPDGSILAVGSSDYRHCLVKYNTNGTLDYSFSNAGSNSPGVYYPLISLKDVKVLPDGKILILGNDDNSNIRKYKLRLDGREESPWDFLIKVPPYEPGYSSGALFLQSDDKVLVRGRRQHESSYEEFITRYNGDGSIDSSFAHNGTAVSTVDGFGNDGSLNSVQMDANGRLLLINIKSDNQDNTDTIAITRYTSAGNRDLTFGNNGTKSFKRITDGTWRAGYKLSSALSADNKMLLPVTTPGKNGFTQMSAQRFDENGNEDVAFGTGGIAASPEFPLINDAGVVLSQPDKKVVVAGYAFVNGRFSVAITRFLADGTPDPAMGNNGITTLAVATGTYHNSIAECVKPLSDGKILAAGYAANGPGSSLVLARFNADGSPDTQFGDGGQTYSTSFFSNEDLGVWSYVPFGLFDPTMMATDKSGNIYVLSHSGNKFTNEGSAALYKFTADGKADTRFGNAGIKKLNIHENKDESAVGLVIQSDDKPVIAVVAIEGDPYNGDADNIEYNALIRLNTDGTIDSTYGANGICKETGLGANVYYMFDGNRPQRLAIQPDDKIIMGSAVNLDFFNNWALGRYTKEGTRDTTFNGGRLVAEKLTDNGGFLSSVAVQPDGKILAGGLFGRKTLCVTRYMPDGSRDLSFGDGGKVITASDAEVANNVVVQPDGRIITFGRKTVENRPLSRNSYPHIVRLTPEGDPDKTFGSSNGLVILQSPPLNYELTNEMAIDNDRMFFAGASATDYVTIGVSENNLFAIHALRNKMLYCNGYTANAGKDVVICRGNESPIGLPGDPANSYSWSPATGLSNPNIAQPVARPDYAGKYVLTVTYPDGCTKKDTMYINVLDKPFSPLAANLDICKGDSISLSNRTVEGYTYSWTSSPAGFVSSEAKPRVSPLVSTKYYLTISDTACTTSDSTTVVVSELATPLIGKTDTTLTVTNPDPAAYYTWQVKRTDNTWVNAGGNASGTTFTPAADGIYRVTAVNVKCSNVSEPLAFSMREPSTPSEPSDPSNPSAPQANHLYPNPATNIITVENISLSENWETLDIIPLADGQAILTYKIAGKTKITIDVSRLTKGYYLAVLKRKGGSPETIRFMKM